MRKNLTKEERLKRRSDFDRVFAVGKRKSCSGARLLYMRNERELSRFAVCPVKKYGTSVQRNRAKRICRELYRIMKDRIPSGFDIVLVIFPGTDTYNARKEQFQLLLERARLFHRGPLETNPS